MPRAKAFDTQETLDRAIACFKRYGYSGASMSILTDEMRIGRQSLYATYGDKRALYLAALEEYAGVTAEYVEERLRSADRPLDAIRSLLRDVATLASTPGYRHGCFLVNSAAELASNDEEVREVVSRGFARIERAYYQALRRALASGELARDKSPLSVARFLVAQMQSIRVIAKTRASRRALMDVVETALTCLE